MSLSIQSNGLADLGRWEDALAAIEEAVVLYRRLVEARPDAFEPDLAMSLNNQSLRLAAMGRWEDALAAIEEACRRMVGRLEKQPFELPDCGLKLVQRYVTTCKEADQPPHNALVERYVRILHSNRIIE